MTWNTQWGQGKVHRDSRGGGAVIGNCSVNVNVNVIANVSVFSLGLSNATEEQRSLCLTHALVDGLGLLQPLTRHLCPEHALGALWQQAADAGVGNRPHTDVGAGGRERGKVEARVSRMSLAVKRSDTEDRAPSPHPKRGPVFPCSWVPAS